MIHAFLTDRAKKFIDYGKYGTSPKVVEQSQVILDSGDTFSIMIAAKAIF
jgi:hypothetical protein